MNTAEVDFSPEALTRAIETNFLETFVLLGSSIGEVVKAGGAIGYFTGVPLPLFNGVVSPQFSRDTADHFIEWFIAQARSRGLPMLWQLGPSSRPHDLADRIYDHGFQPAGEIPGMALDLSLLSDEPPPQGVSIERITDLKALRAAAVVTCEAYEIPDPPVDMMTRMLAAGGTSDLAPLVNYAARIEGEVVGTAAVVYAAGVAGIYNVATAEAYRGRGIGRAITLAPLLNARQRGYRIGILQSSDMGYSVYRRLRFEHYCDFKLFAWSEGSSASEGNTASH